MTTVKEIKSGNREVRILSTGSTFSTLNFVNANLEILSHYNSSKSFKTLVGAERFANKFVNS